MYLDFTFLYAVHLLNKHLHSFLQKLLMVPKNVTQKPQQEHKHKAFTTP